MARVIGLPVVVSDIGNEGDVGRVRCLLRLLGMRPLVPGRRFHVADDQEARRFQRSVFVFVHSNGCRLGGITRRYYGDIAIISGHLVQDCGEEKKKCHLILSFVIKTVKLIPICSDDI